MTVWAVHKCYIEWSLCRSYHITMSLGTEALSHSIWKQYRDSKVDRLGSSRWQAYHIGLATVRAQSPATTCTAICLLAIDGTEGRNLLQHITHPPG